MPIIASKKLKNDLYFLFGCVFLALITVVLKQFPEFVETYYSQGLYPKIGLWFRTVFGWIPFSVGDWIYIISILLMVRWLLINIRNCLRQPRWFFGKILAVLTVVYAAFLLFWGINYYRLPLATTLDIKTNYTTEALQKTVDILTEKSNRLQLFLSDNDSAMVHIPMEKTTIYKASLAGYREIEKDFAQLSFDRQSLKTSTYSTLLTYMGFSGYFNPLTHEGHVDGIMPVNKFPVTALHEQAHQLGYAAEDEANFIAWLTATQHPDPYFQYFGYIFGLKYCLNELYLRDPENYTTYLRKVNKGILANYQESNAFWKAYENPFEPLFKKSFDTYLKANSQRHGIASYDKVVGMIVGYLNKYLQ
ncbi:MAG: DUF3810 domain-containing protein [Flavobacteriaceae bacterium]|nr:DUF3810 domain-containing protein [Flavobacteriaceae bacterium]